MQTLQIISHPNQFSPSQGAIDIVITGILLSLARIMGLKQNIYCDEGPISGLLSASANLHDVTKPSTEIPEVRMQLLKWQVTQHLYV